jgi:hypothetical protein
MNTKRCGCHAAVYEPAVYQICVRGRITANWSDRFEGMKITTTATEDGLVVTTLSGVLADQAALVGVINSLHDLRLAVLCVECVADLPADDQSSQVQ